MEELFYWTITNEDLTGLVPGTYSVKLQMLMVVYLIKQEQ
jgi:hypothetical protein